MLTINSTPHGQLSTRHQPSEIPQIQHHLLPNKAFNKKAISYWVLPDYEQASWGQINIRHVEL